MNTIPVVAQEGKVFYKCNNQLYDISQLHVKKQTDGRRYVIAENEVEIGLYEQVIKNLMQATKEKQFSLDSKKLIKSRLQQLTKESKSDSVVSQVHGFASSKIMSNTKSEKAIAQSELNQAQAHAFEDLKRHLSSSYYNHIAIEDYEVDIPNFVRRIKSIKELEKRGLPLHFAATHYDELLAELLISSGCKIDLVDKNNNNALMIACQLKDPAVAALLISKGVSLTQLNNEADSPLQILMSQQPPLFSAQQLISFFGKLTHEIHSVIYEQINHWTMAWDEFVIEDENHIEALIREIQDLKLEMQELKLQGTSLNSIESIKREISEKEDLLELFRQKLIKDKSQQSYNHKLLNLFSKIDIPPKITSKENIHKQLNLRKKEVKSMQEIQERLINFNDRITQKKLQYLKAQIHK